jgi:thiol-disulfide isomerase/thioredoxin
MTGMRGIVTFGIGAAAVATVLMNAGCATSGGKSLQGSAPPRLAADEWINTDGGKPVVLAELKGKPVVVEFWATWCGPCVAEIPHIKSLYAEHADEGLAVVTLHAPRGADRKDLESFAKDKGMSYPIGLDTSGETYDAYGIEGIPFAVVIDRSGKVIWQGHPGDEAFDRAVKQALAS